MTATNQTDDLEIPMPPTAYDFEDWVALLSASGPEHEDALRRLHTLLLKAARTQVSRMYTSLPALGSARVDDIVNQAADEALVAVLGKLGSFEGRSRFTTWAYKFGILHAAVEVRRNMWSHREVSLDNVAERHATGTSPEHFVEASDFAQAVSRAVATVLTPHQRRVLLALLADDVPVDVLADKLGTTRNALYKTLHDARRRLRHELALNGHLTTPHSPEVSR